MNGHTFTAKHLRLDSVSKYLRALDWIIAAIINDNNSFKHS